LLSGDPQNGLVVPLIDDCVEPCLKEVEEEMRRFDIDRRRKLAESEGDYWKQRHASAAELASVKLDAFKKGS
jgi:hypothetical protein